MAFCSKCGAELPPESAFCTRCGAKAEPSAKDLDGADVTVEFDEADIQQNKTMSVFSYLGLLLLIPIFAAPNSKFARFHANQGLILLIADVIWSLVSTALKVLLRMAFVSFLAPVFELISTLLSLVNLVFLAFTIIGIINVVQGKAKELPIIGKLRILK